MMGKGPSRFGDNLRDRLGTWRCVASSHTLSPTWNGMKGLVAWCTILDWESSRAADASFRRVVRESRRCWTEGMSDGAGRSGIEIGWKPMRSWKGVALVEE